MPLGICCNVLIYTLTTTFLIIWIILYCVEVSEYKYKYIRVSLLLMSGPVFAVKYRLYCLSWWSVIYTDLYLQVPSASTIDGCETVQNTVLKYAPFHSWFMILTHNLLELVFFLRRTYSQTLDAFHIVHKTKVKLSRNNCSRHWGQTEV